MNLIEAADKGNQLETAKALRHKLAETIEKSTSGRDIAALANQLRGVMETIKNLEKMNYQDGETVLDKVRKNHAQQQN